MLLYALVDAQAAVGDRWQLVARRLCGSLFAMEFMLTFVAFDYTSVSRATMLFYTMPFWLALAAHFLIPGERMTLLRTAGLALAVTGVAWALLHNDHPATPYALWGDLMCMAGRCAGPVLR